MEDMDARPTRLGNTATAANPAEKVQRYQTMTEEELGQLMENLKRLRMRLQPVLEVVPEDPNKEPGRPVDPGILSQRIQESLDTIRKANKMVLEMTDRLEI